MHKRPTGWHQFNPFLHHLSLSHLQPFGRDACVCHESEPHDCYTSRMQISDFENLHTYISRNYLVNCVRLEIFWIFSVLWHYLFVGGYCKLFHTDHLDQDLLDSLSDLDHITGFSNLWKSVMLMETFNFSTYIWREEFSWLFLGEVIPYVFTCVSL